MLNSLDEKLLSYTLLFQILNSYPPSEPEFNFLGSKSPYLSPGLCAPDWALQQFPPTFIMLAGVDPLKDDGLFFFERLLSLGVRTRCVCMRLMSHGFLSYYYRVHGLP